MNADEIACPDCAETIKAAAKVCKHCGYRLPVKPVLPAASKAIKRVDPSPIYRCSHCSNPTSEWLAFCIHCKKPLPGPSAVNAQGTSTGQSRNRNDKRTMSGLGIATLTLCSGGLIFGINSCNSSLAEGDRLERVGYLQREIAETRDRIPDLELQCRHGPEESADDIRERSLAEWDAAVGDNLANIAPDQEWAIRTALGREMGLPPSQVNGWKQIYESRAQAAKATLATIEGEKKQKTAERDKERKEICDRLEINKSSLKEYQAELSRLQQQQEKS